MLNFMTGVLLIARALVVLKKFKDDQIRKDNNFVSVSAEIIDSVNYNPDGYAAVYKYVFEGKEYISEGIPMSLKPYNNGAVTTIRVNPHNPNEIDTHKKSKLGALLIEFIPEMILGIAFCLSVFTN